MVPEEYASLPCKGEAESEGPLNWSPHRSIHFGKYSKERDLNVAEVILPGYSDLIYFTSFPIILQPWLHSLYSCYVHTAVKMTTCAMKIFFSTHNLCRMLFTILLWFVLPPLAITFTLLNTSYYFCTSVNTPGNIVSQQLLLLLVIIFLVTCVDAAEKVPSLSELMKSWGDNPVFSGNGEAFASFFFLLNTVMDAHAVDITDLDSVSEPLAKLVFSFFVMILRGPARLRAMQAKRQNEDSYAKALKALVTSLQKAYGDNDVGSVQKITNKILNARYDGKQDIGIFIQYLLELNSRLGEVSEDSAYSDPQLLGQLNKVLYGHFTHFISTIRVSHPNITLDDFVDQIIIEQTLMRESRHMEQHSRSHETANNVNGRGGHGRGGRNGYGGRGAGQNGGRGSRPSTNGPKDKGKGKEKSPDDYPFTCTYCGPNMSHGHDNCYCDPRSSKARYCKHCEKYGHHSTDCFRKKKQGESSHVKHDSSSDSDSDRPS